MKKNNLPEALGIFISLCGLIVMFGWFLNIEVLKSIIPAWVSMKFTTAASFLFSGTMLYFIARFQKKDYSLAVITIPILSMLISLFMISMFASTLFGYNLGVEEMFVRDSIAPVYSVTPGRPSIATMIIFILMAFSGAVVPMNIKKIRLVLIISGVAIGFAGLIAIFGYIFKQLLFTFAVYGKSSAMALHTAILFVLLGIGVVLTGRIK